MFHVYSVCRIDKFITGNESRSAYSLGLLLCSGVWTQLPHADFSRTLVSVCYSCAESMGHSILDILDSPSSEAKPLTSAPSSQKVRNLLF